VPAPSSRSNDHTSLFTNAERVQLGKVIHRMRVTETSYTIARDSLTKHVFVAGVTGAGKTNTIFLLLKEAPRHGVPFLVLEAAKTEYRALLDHPDVRDMLQIFTLGNENVSPFRLNPFEVPPGIPIGVHIDLLRSVFTASFGMWSPLPQVLEQSLHSIYADRGWNVASNTNDRLGDEELSVDAFPTLSDLVAKVDEVIKRHGHDPEAEGRIRGALKARLDSLRAGGKGRLLDVQRSLPIEILLEHPTIIELENMGDD